MRKQQQQEYRQHSFHISLIFTLTAVRICLLPGWLIDEPGDEFKINKSEREAPEGFIILLYGLLFFPLTAR